jgi:hypothetical protein
MSVHGPAQLQMFAAISLLNIADAGALQLVKRGG